MRTSKTILYIDDDADDREFLSDAIKSADPAVEVKTATNGKEALDYLDRSKESNPPCLIVLDLNMPVMDGKQTFSEIRKDTNYHQIPLVIFSSSEKPSDKKMFNDLGVEYYSKPTNIHYLSELANKFVTMCCQ